MLRDYSLKSRTDGCQKRTSSQANIIEAGEMASSPKNTQYLAPPTTDVHPLLEVPAQILQSLL